MTKLIKPFLAIGNALVRWLLRSRLHWLLSGKMVLLQLTGRKSGRTYLVPVSYQPSLNSISVMTYRRRQWWRNIPDGGEVPVYLRGKLTVTVPEVITDDLNVIGTGLLDRSWELRSMIRAKARESVLIRLRFPGSEYVGERENEKKAEHD